MDKTDEKIWEILNREIESIVVKNARKAEVIRMRNFFVILFVPVTEYTDFQANRWEIRLQRIWESNPSMSSLSIIMSMSTTVNKI